METNSRQKVTFEHNGETYNLYVPTIEEKFLVSSLCNNSAFQRSLDLKKAHSTALNGPKGGGKTGTLSVISCLALAIGIPVYLNYPLAFNLKRKDGSVELKKANLINLKSFLKLSKDINYAFVGFSEYQYWANAYRWGSKVNMALDASLQQIRKRNISFYFDVKNTSWVDTITRFEMDVAIYCQDMSFMDPRRNKEGEKIYLTAFDISGRLTGYPFDLYPYRRPIKKILQLKPFWGCYDDKHVLDPYEAMAMKGDDINEIMFGGNGNGRKPRSYREQKNLLAKLAFSGKYKSSEVYEMFGAKNPQEQGDIREMITDFGFKETKHDGARYFNFGNKDAAVEVE